MVARQHNRLFSALFSIGGFLWRLLLAFVKLTLLAVVLTCALAYAAYTYYGRDLPDPQRLGDRPPAESTRIYARDGTLLTEIIDPDLGRRSVVPFDRIPQILKQATIAIEDDSFYENPGVDLRGIIRAVYLNYREGEIVSGGSTITQQLVRSVLLSPEERNSRSFERKLREAILAYRVSREYSKDQILNIYLNEVYYGNQAYGVEAAAQSYFGKHVWELSLAEATLIAGLPQSPSQLNPMTNLEAARSRQQATLNQMVKHGYLTPAQAEEAQTAALTFSQPTTQIRAPHFAYYVRQQLEERYGPDLLYRGGLIVTTTLDMALQQTVEHVLLARIDELRPRNAHNAAAVILSPAGEILAMAGSVDYYQPAVDGQVNVALSARQPGSALKPVVYAAAMLHGWTPATVIWDMPTEFPAPGGGTYVPNNYDGAFHGPMRVRMALANSLNIPAVRALEFVGIDSFLELAHNMGITTLRDRDRYGLSLALGSGEVRLLDLASVYTTLRNQGYRTLPQSILQVTNARGEVLLNQHPFDSNGRPILGPQVLGPNGPQIAYLITDILSDNNARQFMFGPGNVMELPDGRPAAVKTGTTDEFRDSWAIGYTPDVTIGVWVGNSNSDPMEEVAGSNGAGLIWRDLMELYHANLPPHPFDRPPGISEVEICAYTGGLASPACPQNIIEWFVAGSEPKRPDVFWQNVRVGGDGTCLAGPGRPDAREVSFAVYPPQFREWAARQGIPQPPVVPCVPGTAPQLGTVAAAINSPPAGSIMIGMVAVRGTAAGPYLLEVGEGRTPSIWRPLTRGNASPADSALGIWQTQGLPPGEYTLRLTVTPPGQAPAIATVVVQVPE